MEIGELVSLVVEVSGNDSCPFDHTQKPVKSTSNVFPPSGGKNDADELGRNLGADYHFSELVKTSMPDGTEMAVQHSAHHLIPGDASWPNTELKKWVDKSFGHITENIGYDVNHHKNGVSLPGVAGSKKQPDGTSNGLASWDLHPDQMSYAHAAMKATRYYRQFHDSHPTYSDFVVNMLNKISEALDRRIRNGGSPGCGREDCAGDTRTKKPYPPPIGLMSRLERVALNLEGKLLGDYRRWKVPVFTSAWALTLKPKLDIEAAKKELAEAGKVIRGAR